MGKFCPHFAKVGERRRSREGGGGLRTRRHDCFLGRPATGVNATKGVLSDGLQFVHAGRVSGDCTVAPGSSPRVVGGEGRSAGRQGGRAGVGGCGSARLRVKQKCRGLGVECEL